MYPLRSVSVGSFVCLLILWPVLISGTSKENKVTAPVVITDTTFTPTLTAPKPADELLQEEVAALYGSLGLKKLGLTEEAFLYAWKGYKQLLEEKKLKKNDVLSICDFSQSSRRKRFYIIDLEQMKVLVNTYVAHGRNSGGEYARSFSNKPESHKSSLGFYKTLNPYYGEHGLALKIEGLESGINDKADARNIVIHGSDYVSAGYIRAHRYSGRSFGCPAVPKKDTHKVIQHIKGGSCLFIYHPTTRYLSMSRILNG